MRRSVHPVLAVLLAAILVAPALHAQEPPAPTPPPSQPSDSLAERLRRAEAAIESLRTQAAEQAQANVQSRLRNRVEVSGLILVNGFYSNGKTDNSDVPLVADTLLPADMLGLPNANLGGTLRQTRLGLTVSGAHALGAQLSGDVQLDFFGGQVESPGGRTFPLLRVRTASLRLDWLHVGFLAGQEAPLISQRDPVSFASSGFALYTRAGNLSAWIPQARLTWETPGSVHFGLQAAALAPMQYKAQGFFTTQPDSAERSTRPSVEGRVYLAWGSGEAASEIGFGGHAGWIATTGDTLLASTAVAGDFRLALGSHISVAGEGFMGQALAALGGGGIGQDFGVLGVPIRTRGGGVQLDIRPSPSWQFGGGFGMDDPNEDDLPSRAGEIQGRLRNVVYSGHVVVRSGGGLLFGTEFRRIETTYGPGTMAVNHVNAYAGLAF